MIGHSRFAFLYEGPGSGPEAREDKGREGKGRGIRKGREYKGREGKAAIFVLVSGPFGEDSKIKNTQPVM